MASLLDPTDDSGANSVTLTTAPGTAADSPSGWLDLLRGIPTQIGNFVEDWGKSIGDENLRSAGLDPDTVRFNQGLLAAHPELRLPQLPAAPGAGTSDPYVTTGPDPQAQIDAANKGAAGQLGVTLGSTFEGGLKMGTKAGNIVRVDVRQPDGTLVDAKPMTARAVGAMLDEHQASPGAVALYGGRGAGDGADYTVTLPQAVGRAADIATEGNRLFDAASSPEGLEARPWYSEGATAMHGLTGEDFDATQRLAAAHAVTSPQTDVAGNANLAVNAWNQSLLGQPIGVKTAPQNTALDQILYGGDLPESRKTGPFFENHMRTLDPTIANNVTNDIWQMRQMGFSNPDGTPYSGTPSVGEDNYVRMQNDVVTRRLNDAGVDGGGWTPEQVQAALWAHIKSQDPSSSPGMYNFKNGLDRLTASQSNAHQGGEALLGDAASDPQAQGDFHQAASGILNDGLGRDVINSSFGMLTPPGVPGGALLAQTAADGVKPASRDLMNASTLVRATLLRQPDALWLAHSDVKAPPTFANANVVHALSGNPTDYMPALQDALRNAGGGLENAVLQQSPAGVRIVNVNQLTDLDNPTFQGAVKDAINRAGLPTSDLQRARADYGYFQHDWTDDPTGSGYVAQLARLPPHLSGIGDQLFANLGPQLDAAGSQVLGRGQGTGGLPGSSGPWRVPAAQTLLAPGPLPSPLRPWLQRPSPTAAPSPLLSLLRGEQPLPRGGLLSP